MSVEDYLPAVLAGEMARPPEALKAQAILARTFVLQSRPQKESMYDGADISTDIKEAQAYDAAGVNARICEAVEGDARRGAQRGRRTAVCVVPCAFRRADGAAPKRG
ncbi:MAG: SpoIID/LytB domain-containing protein [Christensenellales bacterium]